jgi:hypothetical protein
VKKTAVKKTLLLAALAALALPVAASAHHNPPKHAKHVNVVAPTVAKNAAWLCKHLMAQDKAAFAGTYGTRRNAYGKCVSMHARLKGRLHHHTLTFRNLTVRSTGTLTSAGAPGCQFTDAGCTITSSGTLSGVPNGTYTATWTILWKQSTSNGQGGFCAPAAGTTTLSVPALGTLTKAEQGTVCEVGATGADVEHTLTNGTFTVGGGTGRLTSATGSGTVAFDQKPDGTVTATETFSTLTVTL